MASSYLDDVTTERQYKLKAKQNTKRFPNYLNIDNLSKSGSSWDEQQLLICHVIATKKRGSVLPGLENKPFAPSGRLSSEASSQIQKFLNGPEDEDPQISKHYLVGKYGTNLREIWAALATVTAYKHKAATPSTIKPTTPSKQSGSPSKRPRRSGAAPKYTYSDSESDNPTFTREDSQGSNYAEQVRSKDLPSEDSVVLLITRVLNLVTYCTQPFGAQPVVDFRTERQKMSLQIPGVDGAIVAIDDGGLTLKSDKRINGVMKPELTVALLEAKKCLSVKDNCPVISEEWLGQMVYEAILARDREAILNPNKPDKSIYVINAAAEYVCFLKLDISDAYLQSFRNGGPLTEPLIVTATNWHDLSTKQGRSHVLNNVFGLMELAKE